MHPVEPYPDMPRHGGTCWRLFGRDLDRDFSGYAGLPVELRGAPGLRCDKGEDFGSHQPDGVPPFPQDIRERALGRVHARAETAAPPASFIIAGELDRLREMAVHV